MKFTQQLWMLCWKNFTTRKRKLVRLFVEIAWPILLVSLICLLRKYVILPVKKNECHFASNALPSGGLLPFVQSMACNTLNKCYPNSLTGEMQGEISDFGDAGATQLYQDVEQLLTNATYTDSLETFVTDLARLQEMLPSLEESKNKTSDNLGSLSSILSDSDEVRRFLIQQKNLSSDVADAILGAPASSDMVQSFLQGKKDPQNDCYRHVQDALDGRDVTFVKKSQPQICDYLTQEDYAEISQELWTQVDPSIVLNNFMESSAATLPTNLTLSSLLLNASDVRDYMIDVSGFTAKATDVLLIEVVTPKELHLLLDGRKMRSDVCNVTSLSSYLPAASESDVVEVSDSLCSVTDDRLDQFSEMLSNSLNKTLLINYVGNSTVDSLQQDVDDQINQLMNDIEDLESFNKLLADMIALTNNTDPSTFLCGELTGTIFDAMSGNDSFSQEYGSFASGGIKTISASDDDEMSDNDDKEQSNCTFENQLTNTTVGSLIWDQIKPLLQGYILYYPDTLATRRVIEKAKQPLENVKTLGDLASMWLEYSPTIHTALESSLDGGNCLDLEDELSLLNDLGLNQTVPDLDGLDPEEYLEFVNALDNISLMIVDILKCVELDKFIGFENENELLNAAHLLAENKTFWGAVNFTSFNPDRNDDTIPSYVDYKIRMVSSMVESTHKLNDRFWQPKPRQSSEYVRGGFVYIQDMIETALVQLLTGKSRAEIGVWYHQFPYPCYVDDEFLLLLDGMLPLMMTLAWVFSVAMIIKSIVFEKERRLKEVMKVMGLGNGVHWVAWFIDSFAVMGFSTVVVVIVLKVGRVTTYSNILILLAFMLSFIVSTIMLCFLISVLFSKANLAAACGAVFFFLTYIPYVMVYVRNDRIALGVKVAVSLLNTIAFGYGTRYLALFELQGKGVQWENINSSPLNSDTNLTFLQVIGMLWLDAALYGILTWYIEAVHPGHYGIPKPFYFPFTRSYWCGYRPPKGQDNIELNQCGFDPHDALNANFEKEPDRLKCGVAINGLVKVYKTGKKVAVDNLNMRFYENQITSFLGHNGAGKTTTMSILTGLFPPTAGNATIYGKSILTDIDEIRKSLGMCPQHNVLFDHLTVEEHLWFFARMKGMPKKQVLIESQKMLEDLNISFRGSALPRELSGGMKRKLSIAIAFLGGAKCVILDEPTAGVDPYSRKQIWDLLSKYRKGRTVIMSTHHMDEADILGDRIAIIANGKLKCCGSSLFLKGRYGSGYYLVLTKETTSMQLRGQPDVTIAPQDVTVSTDNAPIEDVGYCSEAIVSAFVSRYVPGAKLCENVGQELSYLLPFGAIRGGGFQKLFAQLEEHGEKLHIKSFGISDTSLEEVFLTVAEESAEFREGDIDLATDQGLLPRPFMGRGSLRRRGYQLPGYSNTLDRDNVALLQNDYTGQDQDQPQELPTPPDVGVELKDEDRSSQEDVPPPQEAEQAPDPNGMPEELLELRHLKVKGLRLIFVQYFALLSKRFSHSRRSLKEFFAQVILPAVFIMFAMLFSSLKLPVEQPQSLILVPWLYGPPNHVVYSNEDATSDLARMMERELTSGVGIGTRCMPQEPLKDMSYPCNNSEDSWQDKENFDALMEKYNSEEHPCSCESGFQECPVGAQGPPPPHKDTRTTDTLHNLTNSNLSDYIIKTTDDFVLQRFGGQSFVLNNSIVTIDVNGSSDTVEAWEKLNDSLAAIPSCGDSDSQYVLPEKEFFEELYEVLLSMATLTNLKVWYNNNGYHALPTYINVMNNLLLRASSNANDSSSLGITVHNHPINFTSEQVEGKLATQLFIGQFIAQFVMFGFAFIPAGFIIHVITERVNNSKHLQIVSGVNRTIYWLATFHWDMVNFLLPLALTFLIFLFFQMQAFIAVDVLPGVIILFLLYGFASIPMTYPVSLFFEVPSTGYLAVGCFNILTGMVTVMTMFFVGYYAKTGDPGSVLANDILRCLFLIFPSYCLGDGLVKLSTLQLSRDISSQFNMVLPDPPPPIFAWEGGIGRNLVALMVEGVLFLLLTWLIEYKFFLTQKPRVTSNSSEYEEIDEDVNSEKQRVLTGGAERDVIKIEKLRKVYSSGHVAVNDLCVGIPRGECFGFLGVNGAGKTTTFKMLTGDIPVTGGDAQVNSYSVVREIRNVNKSIGYCPQFDALDEMLTGREHLKFYARLRGVPEEYLSKVADWGIRKLGLTKYADRLAGTYSGGNKRKLSTAIALVGNPPVVFMDEPTTGMDPKSRRFLWNCISNIVQEGRSVVLTTHSMEECEALCTRLAIMVNGKFECLGSTQHLKSKFGAGYCLTIRASSSLPSLQPIQDFIRANFPSSVHKETHLSMLEYQLPIQDTTLSRVFGIIEAHRGQLEIEDYSISQTTLDQVFIKFAQGQRNDGSCDTSESVVAPNVLFNNPVLVAPGYGVSTPSVHIPEFGSVHMSPSAALPYRNHYTTTPGYNNPLHTIPASPQSYEEGAEEGGDTSSLNLQEFGGDDSEA